MKLILTAAILAMSVAHITSLKDARYALIIGLILLVYIVGKRVYFAADRHWYTIGGIIIIGSFSYASYFYGDNLSYVYVVFAVLNFLLYPIYERAELTNFHLTIIFSGLLISLVPLGVGKAVISIYDNPNNYSAVVFSAMYFGMLLFRDRWLGQVGVMGVTLMLIYLGASRSMLGATLIFAILYFLQRWLFRTTFRSILLAGFVVAGFGYFSLITNDQFKLMELIQNNTELISRKKKVGLSHRDELFEKSMELIQRQPAGYGLGRSNAALRKNYGTKISPHNTYLKVLLEGGWLALVGYGIIIIGFLLTNRSPLAAAFMLSMLIRGFFESSTPFTLSLVSGMLILPIFLHEGSIGKTHRLVLRREKADFH